MTDPNRTLVAVLLDRSGSMDSIKSDTQGGFDTYVRGLCEQPGDCQVRITLAQFDTEYTIVYSNLPVDEVPPLTLTPRGMTALYDSVARLTTDVGTELAALPEDQRPGTVIIVIMTDGMENASREWTGDAVRALVKQQQDQWNWTYLFLGANIDAPAIGEGMGIARGRSMTYATNSAGVGASFDALSRVTTAVRAGADVGFLDEERHAAVDPEC